MAIYTTVFRDQTLGNYQSDAAVCCTGEKYTIIIYMYCGVLTVAVNFTYTYDLLSGYDYEMSISNPFLVHAHRTCSTQSLKKPQAQ